MLNFNSKLPTDIKIGNKTVETVWMRNEVVWGRVQEYFYIENTYNGSNRVDILVSLNNPTNSHMTELQYSTDKLNWTTYQLSNGSTSITLSQGQRVYFRNDSGYCNTYESDSDYWVMTFNPTQSYIVGGNINSLVKYTDMYNVSLPKHCYYKLFNGSSTLTSAADLTLVSSTASEGCYRNMFKDCTSLVSPPSIKATILGSYCYEGMLQGCSSLTTAPALIASGTMGSCYRNMFRGCTSLTTAPELPATQLSVSCYQSMFQGCSSLVNPPDLPADTLKENCYYGMFLGCSSLDHINVYADDNSATNCTSRWLENVASSGTFNNYGNATYTYPSVDGIPQGWASTTQINYFYVKNEYNGTNNITFRALGTPTANTIQQIEYSKNKTNWTTETITSNMVITIPLSQGEKVYFRNDNGYFSNNLAEGNGKFRIKIRATQNHSIGGDITTLYNYSYNPNVTMPEGCFRYLFGVDLHDVLIEDKKYELNPNLIDASQLKLPSFCLPLVNNKRTLPTGCYAGMFMMTSGLINPPQSIQCQGVGEESCHRMFKGSHITNTPELPATVIATNGYTEMFMVCKFITSVPVLPATSVGEYAYYYMFSGCDNISGTVTLPATTPSKRAYIAMFNECPSLTTAIISATTLKEKTLGMLFYNCSSMSDITVYATNINPSNMTFGGVAVNWVNGVSETGTFHNLGSLTIPSGKSGIPSGWTITTT